jgi:hypothetical protein
MNPKYTKLIAILFILVCVAGYALSTNTNKVPPVNEPVSTTPTSISMKGEIVCLPHINTDGPQTMECAYGVKDVDGVYYALVDEDSNFQNISNAPMNTPVLVEGMLTIQKSDRYQSIGTIEVTHIQTIAVPPTSPQSGTEEIGFGQTKLVGPISITLHSVVQDNRCPTDVVCIEAGAITARVTLSMGPNSETFNMPSDEVPHEFWGYKVSITNVKPNALSTKTINPKDYKVAFHVEKI